MGDNNLSVMSRVTAVQMARQVRVKSGLEKYHILKSAKASSITQLQHTYEIIKLAYQFIHQTSMTYQNELTQDAHLLLQNHLLINTKLSRMGDKLQQQFLMPSELEAQLIMNSLPYPQNYNGLMWNSKVGRTRRNIPEYLREDLPPLQYTYIRQQFKQMDKIQCPRLTYFKNKILIKKTIHPDPPPAKRRFSPIIKHETRTTRLEKQLLNIREEMKYALILTDRKSNVITELINRANVLEQQRDYKVRRKAKLNFARGHSLGTIKNEDKCFPDTLGLVLSARKRKSGVDTSQDDFVSMIAQQKVSSIKLMPLNQQDLY